MSWSRATVCAVAGAAFVNAVVSCAGDDSSSIGSATTSTATAGSSTGSGSTSAATTGASATTGVTATSTTVAGTGGSGPSTTTGASTTAATGPSSSTTSGSTTDSTTGMGTGGAAVTSTIGAGGASTATAGGAGGSVGAGGKGSGGAGGAGTGGGGGGSPPPKGTACGRATVPVTNPTISTFDEVTNPLGATAVVPGGAWTADSDGTGMTSLVVEDTGEPAQKMAAHFTGSSHVSWGASMGTPLSGATLPTGVDASAYTGLSFKVKPGPNNVATMLSVRFENEDAVPACKLCDDSVAGKDCHGGYVYLQSIPVASGWTTVTIPFARAVSSSYGNHASTQLDSKQIFTLTLAIYSKVQAFDLYLDDVQFYK